MDVEVSAMISISAYLRVAYDLIEVLDSNSAGCVAPYFEQGANENDPEVVAAVSDEGLVALDE